jgi:hypothetical protein
MSNAGVPSPGGPPAFEKVARERGGSLFTVPFAAMNCLRSTLSQAEY